MTYYFIETYVSRNLDDIFDLSIIVLHLCGFAAEGTARAKLGGAAAHAWLLAVASMGEQQEQRWKFWPIVDA